MCDAERETGTGLDIGEDAPSAGDGSFFNYSVETMYGLQWVSGG